MQRPCAVAPSSCASSVASKGIQSVGVRVTSWPRARSARCSGPLDVSASRCSLGLGMLCGESLFCQYVRVDLGAVGLVEGQALFDLLHGQAVVCRDLGGGHAPVLCGDDECLNAG